MPKLNQIIAIEKGTKTRAATALTEVYQSIQKADPMKGIARSYEPKDEDGDKFPPESTRVQIRAAEAITAASAAITELFDIAATKDLANCKAVASVEVDGKVLIQDAPVTYLLFVEKQLVDLHTFIKKLPTLDASVVVKFEISAAFRDGVRQTLAEQT